MKREHAKYDLIFGTIMLFAGMGAAWFGSQIVGALFVLLGVN